MSQDDYFPADVHVMSVSQGITRKDGRKAHRSHFVEMSRCIGGLEEEEPQRLAGTDDGGLIRFDTEVGASQMRSRIKMGKWAMNVCLAVRRDLT